MYTVIHIYICPQRVINRLNIWLSGQLGRRSFGRRRPSWKHSWGRSSVAGNRARRCAAARSPIDGYIMRIVKIYYDIYIYYVYMIKYLILYIYICIHTQEYSETWWLNGKHDGIIVSSDGNIYIYLPVMVGKWDGLSLVLSLAAEPGWGLDMSLRGKEKTVWFFTWQWKSLSDTCFSH